MAELTRHHHSRPALSCHKMVRTQISLDAKEYALARKHAKALGISVTELMRRAIREQLQPESNPPWMRYSGMVQSGNPGSNVTVDEIVYGSKGR